MKIKTEKDIIRLIENDEWMMNVLQMAKSLELPDWWVCAGFVPGLCRLCAGFVRSKIWDTLHDYEAKTAMPDVDVIYYDSLHQDEIYEQSLETKLMNIDATIPWSVKNQARMHVVNNMPPYSSSVNAISKFPETATALGVTLDELNNVILTAPCGIEDVLSLQVRPTAHFLKSKERLHMYKNRVIKKNWQSKWPNITITYPEI
ncbi:nucleotidyltransferase family protein [Bacillus thuringiensis]|uniref:nucleotidyltransferase family protein n=3 Tax=Bacillales TaxID=1385 RepID=UPI003B97DDF5